MLQLSKEATLNKIEWLLLSSYEPLLVTDSQNRGMTRLTLYVQVCTYMGFNFGVKIGLPLPPESNNMEITPYSLRTY